MQKEKYIIASALLIAIAVFLSNAEVDAACASPQDPNCADFGNSTIEFLGTTATTCNLPAGSATFVPCTAYFYQFTGDATNQLSVAIPKAVMTKYKASDKAVAGCSQLITDGGGDSTTKFGTNLLTHNICRVALTLTQFPGAPAGANLRLTADPSTPELLDWQLNQPKIATVADTLNGPSQPQAPIAETGATLTTLDGVSITYTNIGGQITITGGSGTVVPIDHTKLCVLKPGGDPSVPYTSPAFPANWTCETITFATEQCDIKTAGTDPCRFIGNTCVSY